MASPRRRPPAGQRGCQGKAKEKGGERLHEKEGEQKRERLTLLLFPGGAGRPAAATWGSSDSLPLISLSVSWALAGGKGTPRSGVWGSDIGQAVDDEPGQVAGGVREGNVFVRYRCC